MARLPVTVFDTAYLYTPVRAAVSRVVLRPWCENRHPDTPVTGHTAPLSVCMQDAFSWVSAEAPEFHHGLLVYGVQKYQGEDFERPSVSTLRQYVTRHTILGNVFLPAPAGADCGDYVTLISLSNRNVVPKWVWHHLSASLIHPAGVIGDAPPFTW